MISKLLKKIVGTRNDRLLRGYRKLVQAINALEPTIQALSDEALKAKTAEFKSRLAEGKSLDSLLPEAFAVVREVSRRTLEMRHFDVQLIGGMTLHFGKVAEMRTGEGKTLSATLPAYLNALTGKGVHVVTVNDYLAKRDADWMRPVYEFLGMTVGVNLTGMQPADKQAVYAADITYGTNNEFGFDYLRDNMIYRLEDRVQRPLHYAIIDEVDSILIDESRTPLIISGQAEASSDLYQKVDQLIPQLKQQIMAEGQKEEEVPEENRGDFVLDEKNRQAFLTDQGHQHVEELLIKAGLLNPGESLYDVSNITTMHYVNAALRAHHLFQRDVHYVVKNNEIMIVDEHTGRLMPGRRWSEGLHQAVEAKERVEVQLENQTLATITFQNYFRLYEKLSGMTGTADTEAFELQKIYGLEVVVIPTNKPMIRDDRPDLIFLTEKDKYKAIVADIQAAQEKGQPVLVGTASIESSERVSHYLNQLGIKHNVLNAKQHEREAHIIAEAGRSGYVTIATNMAGRGTDIVLGGSLEAQLVEVDEADITQREAIKAAWQKTHEAVIQAGGLHVLGTERHESRRIDNQLRGRSGRQGDPGSSQFYLSLQDNLLRIFAAERMANMMRKLGIKEGDVIQHPWITRAIENAQRRVEGMNFDMRKQLLEYDDVANDQRKVFYQQRYAVLTTEDISDIIAANRDQALNTRIDQYIPPQSLDEQWDIAGLTERLSADFGIHLPIQHWLDQDESLHEDTLRQKIIDHIATAYTEKTQNMVSAQLRDIEKSVMLQVLDHHWKDHLAAMDHLRQGIHLRGYAQKNPTQEYKRECFELFTNMLTEIKYETASTLSKLEFIAEPEERTPWVGGAMHPDQLTYVHDETSALAEMTHDAESEAAMREEAMRQAGGSMPAGISEPGVEPAEWDDVEGEGGSQQPFVREAPKVGRNDPCPCGSGKKYKQCHGRLT